MSTCMNHKHWASASTFELKKTKLCSDFFSDALWHGSGLGISCLDILWAWKEPSKCFRTHPYHLKTCTLTNTGARVILNSEIWLPECLVVYQCRKQTWACIDVTATGTRQVVQTWFKWLSNIERGNWRKNRVRKAGCVRGSWSTKKTSLFTLSCVTWAKRHARLQYYLEGDGEVSETLSEDPDDGVAEPHDDGEASSPSVDGAGVSTLGLGRLSPGLAESEDDVHEPAHAEEPPHPLDVAHSQGAESSASNHENCTNTFKNVKLAPFLKKWSHLHESLGESMNLFLFCIMAFCKTSLTWKNWTEETAEEKEDAKSSTDSSLDTLEFLWPLKFESRTHAHRIYFTTIHDMARE